MISDIIGKSLSYESEGNDSGDCESEVKMATHVLKTPLEKAKFSDSDDDDDDVFSDAESSFTESSPTEDAREKFYSFSGQGSPEADRPSSGDSGCEINPSTEKNETSTQSPERKELAASHQQQQNRWVKAAEMVMESVPALKTRRGRAGVVHNFLRGLRLEPPKEKVKRNQVADREEFSFVNESTKKTSIELIDAGLQFNSPYPPVLRPERDVDLILSFDFSARDKDSVPPFKVRPLIKVAPPLLTIHEQVWP